jgi:hypothetical protein
MPRRNAIDVIAPAWEHMRQILFPLRWAVWWRVALLGLVTGELHSGNGLGGFNYRVPSSHAHDNLALYAGMPPAWVIVAIALGITALFVLMVVFTYVASVCRFILFESVLTRRLALRAGWRKWQPQGLRLFGFNLVIMLVSLTMLLAIVVPAFLFAFHRVGGNPRGHLLLLIGGGALLLTVLLIVFFAISLVYVLVKDFVVPQMALEDVSVMEGWRRLWTQIGQERGAYAGYIGMKIVLALGAALAIGIAMLVLILILLIPGVIIALIMVALKSVFGLAFLVVLIPIAIVALFALIFAIGLLGSPISIFFPAYSMHFFADRYPPLAALLYPPPPPSPAPIPPSGPDLAPAT